MTLLEREPQIERLCSLIASARRGDGRVCALLGEAGAGKTALMQAFVTLVADKSRVLRSACEDLSIPDALGPLYDLARDARWSLSRDQPHHITQRIPLFSEALEVFETPGQPTLVVIEDLHWADDATLDFVRFIGRRIVNTHVLVLITARNDGSEGQKRVRRALGDIPADNIVRIDVPFLSERAVDTLARACGQDGGAIYNLTAGNAFYVTECLRAGGTALPPPSISDAVLTRTERLSPQSRQILNAVAIFPRRAPPALLLILCGVDSAAAVSECLAHGVLEESAEGYAFRHEIARRAVEMAMPAAARCDLNARLLAALRASDDVPAARLVHHAIEAGDARAVRELAPVAAQQASRFGAHREAVRHYETLLQQPPSSFSEYELAELNERYAFECHVTGQVNEAIAAQNTARRLHQTRGDRVREGDCLRWLSRLNWLVGDRVAAETFGREAVTCLEIAPPGAELAMAYSNLAQLAMLADRSADAIFYGEKAIALAEPLSRNDILCHALTNIGTAMQLDDLGGARACLDRSLRIALEAGFQEEAARSYTNRGCLELDKLELSAAERWLSDGINYCIERELDTWKHYMVGHLADALLYLGRWDEATVSALGVVDNEQATPLMRYPSVMALARLRLRRGDPAAEVLFAELNRFLEKAMEFQRLAPYACLIAEQAWLNESDPVAALGLIAQAEQLVPKGAMEQQLRLWRHTLEPGREGDDWRAEAAVWKAFGAPYQHAVCLSRGDAEAQAQAVIIFDGLGARPVAGHVRAIMRRKGITAIPRDPVARNGNSELTERESEVLQLISKGLSNKGIAKSLRISPKTVDHHVSAVLRKLDAASRSQAAAIAREANLL